MNKNVSMYYFIAQIKINNHSEYQKYINEAGDIFKKFKGKYIVANDQPETLEGEWKYTREIVIEFKNKEDFDDWYYSEDYQRILKYRLGAAKCDSILVKGLEQ